MQCSVPTAYTSCGAKSSGLEAGEFGRAWPRTPAAASSAHLSGLNQPQSSVLHREGFASLFLVTAWRCSSRAPAPQVVQRAGTSLTSSRRVPAPRSSLEPAALGGSMERGPATAPPRSVSEAGTASSLTMRAPRALLPHGSDGRGLLRRRLRVRGPLRLVYGRQRRGQPANLAGRFILNTVRGRCAHWRACLIKPSSWSS